MILLSCIDTAKKGVSVEMTADRAELRRMTYTPIWDKGKTIMIIKM